MHVQRHIFRSTVAAIAALGVVGAVSSGALAAPPAAHDVGAPTGDVGDDMPGPLQTKQIAQRREALLRVLKGDAKVERRNGRTVVDVGTRNKYVPLSNEGTDRVFVLLVEFGNSRHPSYPDQDTAPGIPGPALYDGPLHDAMPEPAKKDNRRIWQEDFDRAHFEELYFGAGKKSLSLKTYLEKQSSGRYSIDGTVTDWVKLDYNEARYGRSDGFPCGGRFCSNTFNLVLDGMNAWYDAQVAAGRTPAEITAELATFDVEDRYDYNDNGNFDEPDGYIDHLQIIHAGGDQSDGDVYQGEDAIWSHRSYAFPNTTSGPAGNQRGGAPVGMTGIWAADYTIQAENSGLSTVAHEYGHDLGLPDLYDTSGGENGVNWWSIMGQSRVGAAKDPVGLRAADFGAWEKLFLGWSNVHTVASTASETVEIGPHEYNSELPQALVVTLPDRQVDTVLGTPYAGGGMWWSSKGNDLATTMTRDLALSAVGAAGLDFQANLSIEADFDYLYVQYSTDGGANWTSLGGTTNGLPFTIDGNGQPALTGSTGGSWLAVHVDLAALRGVPTKLRFLYRTDDSVAEQGALIDAITITSNGSTVVASGGEASPEGWTLAGFTRTTGTETAFFPHYYIASNRTYAFFDKYMKTGPWNAELTDPNRVEHFPYLPGLLVSYFDSRFADNNTSTHPGQGLVLPIDAHPTAVARPDTTLWRPRVAGYDAPFDTKKTKALKLHIGDVKTSYPSHLANPVFLDTSSYFDPAQPTAGVTLPAAGVRIEILKHKGAVMELEVN